MNMERSAAVRNYITLGEGRSTKVLSVAPHVPARAVTTCDVEVAKRLCYALSRTDRCLPAELFDLAVSLDGEPVEARRTLLSFFDAALAGSTVSAGAAWVSAESLVASLAEAVTDASEPVRRAVRDELADHLTGMDGVLVPARAVLDVRKSMTVDLVISGPLGWLGDSFWSNLLNYELELVDDDQRFPLGGPLASSIEFYLVLHELYDVEPSSDAFTAFSVQDLFRNADDDSGIAPELMVRADHLLAWVARHRPVDVEAVRQHLSTES